MRFQLFFLEIKRVFRDPLYVLLFVSPVMIALVNRYAVPFVLEHIAAIYQLQTSGLQQYILLFFMGLPAFLPGIMVGLMLIEEREESVLTAWAVSPVGLYRYVRHRAFFTFILAFISSFLLYIISEGFPQSVGVLSLLFFSLAVSLTAPLLMGLLFVFAKDRVRGLAYAKIAGLWLVLPFIYCINAPCPIAIVIRFLYPFWTAKAFFLLAEGHASVASLFAIILQVPLLWGVYRRRGLLA